MRIKIIVLVTLVLSTGALAQKHGCVSTRSLSMVRGL